MKLENKIKVSIITVNLNNKLGLQNTINSVAGQDLSQIEFIIMDGKSNDGSIDLIKANKEIIDIWCSEEDDGVYHAMNKGIIKATGDYLIFMNSGDIFFDNKVISNFIENCSGENLIYGNAYFKNNDKVEKVARTPKLTIGNVLTNTICHQSIFYHKSICNEDCLYDSNYRIVADWVFTANAIIFSQASHKYIDCDICICEPPGLSIDPRERGLEREAYIKDTFSSNFIELLEDFNSANSKLSYLKNRLLVKASLAVHRVKGKIVKGFK